MVAAKTREAHTIEQLDCPASTHFNIFRECFAFFQLMMTLALLPFCNEPCARPDRQHDVAESQCPRGHPYHLLHKGIIAQVRSR